MMSDRFVIVWCSSFDFCYQVQVEYWGEGSVVELAGSFNGWKHFVVMKPDLTSEISKPDGSR